MRKEPEQIIFENMNNFPVHINKNLRENNDKVNFIPSNAIIEPLLHYSHENGQLYVGDSIKWLKSLNDESVDLIFADPPYNIKKAEWDTFESQQAYIDWSLEWIVEASRVLKSNGSLYICGFSEILADLKHPASKYFKGCKWLVWHYKNKANLGKDFGRSHESLLHFRKSTKFTMNQDFVRIPYGNHTLKYPTHPQALSSQYGKGEKQSDWIPHVMGAKGKDVIEVPTTCNGMNEKTPHKTQKPEELVRKFILASSNRGDLVIDPFSGSGTTAVVAEQLGRKWMACDLSSEYNTWAIDRIRKAKKLSDQEWFWFDRKNEERRKK
ncbi:DNA-methyltransferase [Paenibacillus nuruki]|uniref:DNA-methyltransferase n=1 Tax=Paenibacillus nuruki TaxID=1886670 RepID=UPI002805C32E|nr:site-specific DNA-methyltransferase [Paenibacillus nuruki]CAJ1313330.1 Methyltransferase [Paenibacillus nuruki]